MIKTKDRREPTPRPGENRDGWMTFRHSGPLNVERLTPALIDVRDIVAGLSGINRFNGQLPTPITVLWHSLMVSELCAEHDAGTQLEALLHDVNEAYLGDPLRPVRMLASPRLKSLHHEIRATCLEASGLPGRHGEMSKAVHTADYTMLRYEAGLPFGFKKLPTWYPPLDEGERANTKRALKVVGQPRPGSDDAELHHTMFVQELWRLMPQEAPLRKSVEETLGLNEEY